MRAVRQEAATARGGIADAKILSAKVLIRQMVSNGAVMEVGDVEFRVFSQFCEDGIIQYLIRRADIRPNLTSFVEFGVEDYSEANTRFLLMNDNWRGLIMDGDASNVAAVNAWRDRWKYDLTAKHAFIDRDNIDGLLAAAGFVGQIGLLSIDIDGNDYWVWERVSAVDPVIVVVEYNSLFGASRAVSVPYDPAFDCGRAHYSHLYWGSSLRALELLGIRKGYALVGCNSAGNNAFFVKRDRLNGQPALTSEQAYKEARFRISRDRAGYFNFLTAAEQYDEIADMPLDDVETHATLKVSDLAWQGRKTQAT